MATDDTMENGWGVKYVTYTEKRCGRRSFVGFQADIESAVPGFTLYSVQMCGTDANAVAISLATDYNYDRCLFALGSYIGGDERHQSLSSSVNSPGGLAMPKYFDEGNFQCQVQTVPLPYHVPSSRIKPSEVKNYENRCLLHLHQRLVYATLTGSPFKALLLEFVLGGNGGELSTNFLKDLGKLLKHFKVVVVADEVMTGGRNSSSVTLSTTMPREFFSCVQYITLGKFVGCGMVLTRKTREPLDVRAPLRGFSTQAECGLPSKLFQEVLERMKAGMVEKRRSQVLKLMNCDGLGKEEDHWGRGMQIYTTYTRGNILYGLKNRLLPRLEMSKLRKNGVSRSKWTRSTVSEALRATADEWIQRQQLRMWEGEHSFVFGIITCVFDKAQFEVFNHNKGITFRAEDVIQFLGKRCNSMAEQHNAWTKTVKGRRSYAKAETLVYRAVIDSVANSRESRLLIRKRVGWDRAHCAVFDSSSFEIYHD